MRWLLLILLMASPAWAGINVPEEIKSPPEPIVATVDAEIPDGAQSKGKWGISGTGEANIIEVNDTTIHIWAEPGTYTLEYTGMWVDFENKMFDFEGMYHV